MSSAPAADPGESWRRCMLLGQYEDAWRISDAVLAGRSPADANRAGAPAHERFVWTGESPIGKTVLIRCYHGLGDTIQFIRFAETLAVSGSTVFAQAQPALIPLLRSALGIRGLVPLDWRTPEPAHDVALESMEIPHALRLGLADLPGRNPYLAPPPDRIAERAARMGRDGRSRVGLAWAAGDWDRRRTVPLAALQPLAGLRGVAWHSLQRGGAEAALNAGIGPAVENPDDRSLDIVETAALIANLDLVVTVDTMVAHLAGAMGRPVWLLLHHDADWRWLIDRDDSPWYPGVRLFRQPAPGAWEEPIARIARLLA